MSKAIDYSTIKNCLISKTSKDDWDNHLTELENLEKMMDVIRNFMSDERNFEYIDGHLKLQSITERLALREDVLSKYAKVFNDGLSMLQEKFRADRQRVFDSQMEDFSKDM